METLAPMRLLGRAWGVASMLLGLAGAAIVVLFVVAVVRDLVTPSHPAPHFNVHDARPAHIAPAKPVARSEPYRPEPAPAPVYVPPQPAYAYPAQAPAALQYAWLQQQYLAQRQPAMMPPRFVYAGHGFGLGHAFGGFGHFGHGGRR